MGAIKVKGGYKIQTDSGKVFPKLYKTKEAVNKRINELDRHAPPTKKKK